MSSGLTFRQFVGPLVWLDGRPLASTIEPYRFMSLMGAMTVFHFAAMPWLTLGKAIHPWGRNELEKHKREIQLVARTMLGIKLRTPGGNR